MSLLLGAAACGGAGEATVSAPPPAPPPAVTEPPPAAVPAAAPITFATCPLQTGGTDTRAECANVEVPLDWANPDGRKVKVFVKRLPGTATGARKQLWLLQGGPGGAGDGLEPLANEVAKSNASFDIYIPDHRGTGRSAFLDCPTAVADYPFDYGACAAEARKEWGADGFATFTTTTAARDMGHIIERTRAPGQEVHVYGVSYGTYWAQRYLQLFPTQATAVTLDSICGAGLCSYMKIGYWFDRVGKKFMSECGADATCSSMLGPDPIVKVRDAIAVADARTCSGLAGVNGAALRQLFQWFIASVQLRVLVPAIAFRTVRCNTDDVTALKKLVSVIGQMSGGFDGPSGGRDLSSTVLGFHIAFSEMEANPALSRSDLAKLLEGAVFTSHDTSIRDAFDAWPKYARDAHVGKYPSVSVPVLLMNGTLDPQTPQEFAEEVATHYTGAAQTFFLLPRAAHGVIHQSPTSTSRDACGMTVWQQFLADPKSALDTSCKNDILKHDFSDAQPLAQSFFGVPSLWGANGAPPGAPIPGPSPLPGDRGAPLTPSEIRAELESAMRATTPWMPVRHTREAFASALRHSLFHEQSP